MSKTLEYLERTIEKLREKTADEIRQEDLSNYPLHQYYLKLHKEDVKKGLVRLVDGRIKNILF